MHDADAHLVLVPFFERVRILYISFQKPTNLYLFLGDLMIEHTDDLVSLFVPLYNGLQFF